MSKAIKVLVVDDSALVRNALTEILSSDPEIEVVGSAADPFLAAKKMETVVPDVMTLGRGDCRAWTASPSCARSCTSNPMPVVICSTLTEKGSDTMMRALEAGAVDIIQKPKVGTRQFFEESRIRICDAVKAAGRADLRKLKPKAPVMKVQPKLTADAVISGPAPRKVMETTEKVVIVGASTGGTEALRVFLEAMPRDSPAIAIVQHMPEKFTAAFAKRLDGICRITVKEARDNDTMLRGQALIAPGNMHMLLKRSGARYHVEVKEGPLVRRHRPSVDVLFRSAARYAGGNAIGVIMTGMGDDGAEGMKEMKDAGAYTIAQDEASCVVFGMPQEAIKHGGVDKVMGLERIAQAVVNAAG